MLDAHRLLRSSVLGLGLVGLAAGCTGSNDALQSGGGGTASPETDAGPSGGGTGGGSGGDAPGGAVGGETGGGGGGDADDDGLGDVCDPCPATPDPTGDPAACAAECEAGVVESRPCVGVDVREERTCVDGVWGPYSGCPEPPECAAGATDVQPCPDAPAVSRIRLCVDGRWGAFSACEPECVPDAIEARPCDGAPAVEQRRTCDGGLWTAWSACEPDCVPLAREVRPCADGSPGTEYRTCDGGLWSLWSACALTPECDDGTRQIRDCAAPQGPGTQMRDCIDGFWGGWNNCAATPVCVDGEVQTQACQAASGRPGEQSRTCVGGFWAAFSACQATPDCAAGQEQRRVCGLNGRGTDVRTCVDGFYSIWACTDPDVCIDGSVRNLQCPESAASQVSECFVGQWGPYSDCPAPSPCDAAVQIVEIGDVAVDVEVSTVGRADAFGASCGLGARGADALLVVRVPVAGQYRFDVVSADYDTVMSLRGLCDQLATERACNDDVANRDTRSGFAVNLEAGEYSLLVDGFEVGGAGTSTIRIRPPLPPAACIDDNNEAPAAATPLGVLGIDPIELRGASLCPMVDPSDFYGFQLETGGLVFADVRPTEPLTGGTVFGAFFRGNAGIGGAVQSDAAFNVRAYVATGGDYAFAVQGNAFNGPYGYDVDLYHSPSITCEAAQRPGCIACTDAFDPNDNINQARPIVLNGDYANLFVCGADFDFYSVQLAANREVRIDVDINAMLGDFALSLTDGRDAAPLQMSIDGLRYTFRWTPAVAGRYYVNIRPNPGEVSYRLRVSQ